MSGPHFNRSFVLEAPVKLADGAGGYTQTWEPLGVLWAEVKAQAGRERAVVGGSTTAQVPYKMVVRAAPAGSPSRPKPGQRLRDGNRIFDIHAVADTDIRLLTCHVIEEVAP